MQDRIREGLEKIKNIVSPEWYFDNEADINLRGQAEIPTSSKPLAFIYPENTKQIKEILNILNEYCIPVWPISKGKNWGFGAATAVRDGSIIMVLERMNKIIEVNVDLAYAVVEPGVTYEDLHKYLTEKNINLFCDSIDGPSSSSIIGNALERGRGRGDYGDHFANLCGLEIILPNGETLKTGGGPDNSKIWNVYKYGVGPNIDGLFTQGNYGIVTKGGIWLMPKHEVCISIFLDMQTTDNFIKAVDIFRKLQLEGVIESKMSVVTDCFILTTLVDCEELRVEDGYLTNSDVEQLRQMHSVGKWVSASAIYGTPDVIKVKQRRIKKELASLGRLVFIDDKKHKLLSKLVATAEGNGRGLWWHKLLAKLIQKVTGKKINLFLPMTHLHNCHKGIPSNALIENVQFGEATKIGHNQMYDMTLNKTGIIWFMPVIPLIGEQLASVSEELKAITHLYKFDYAAGIVFFEPRCAAIILKISYDKENQERSDQAMSLFRALHQWSIENGYQVYRTNVAHMEEVIDCAPVFKSFLNEIKATIDPNNIIAPGKYGVG